MKEPKLSIQARPNSCLLFADRLLAFDHELRVCYLVALYEEEESVAEDWFDAVEDRLKDNERSEFPSRQKVRLRRRSSQTTKREGTSSLDVRRMWENLSYDAGIHVGSKKKNRDEPERGKENFEYTFRHNKDGYMRRISDCLKNISDGESYELCLTNQISSSCHIHPLLLHIRLRKINPAPYAAFFLFNKLGADRRLHSSNSASCTSYPYFAATEDEPGGEDGEIPYHFAIICSSPERFIKVSQSGICESKPIKGTLRRGKNPKEDEELATQLRTSVKDRAENLMIVDLIRNDLGRVCRTGTVTVPKLMDVESYATVHQLVSTVRGILLPTKAAADCFKVAFPPGSMTGAPKLRSTQILDRLEEGPRGIYSGSLGFFSLTGAADWNVVIRTAVCTPDGMSIGTGGAIVSLSSPEEEYEEIMLKAKALLNAIGTVHNEVQHQEPVE